MKNKLKEIILAKKKIAMPTTDQSSWKLMPLLATIGDNAFASNVEKSDQSSHGTFYKGVHMQSIFHLGARDSYILFA